MSGIHDQFGSRIYGYTVCLENGSLGLYIEAPDRIHLVAPEFYTIRVILSDVIYIQNSATHRKLTRIFDHIPFLISKLYQHGRNSMHIQSHLRRNTYHSVPDDIGTYARHHECAPRRDHRHGAILHQGTQTHQALTLDLIARDIRLVEYHVLSGEYICVTIVEKIVLTEFATSGIGIRDDQARTEAVAQRIDHVELLRTHTACNVDRPGTFRQGGLHFVILWHLPYRRQQSPHSCSFRMLRRNY